MSEKRTYKMRVIPEPAPGTRGVLMPGFKGPVLTSFGPLSYTCGACEAVLLKDMDFKQVKNAVVKCGGCGAFNEIAAEHHGN